MVPFSILGYRRGIARVSPEIRELCCLALFCVVAAAAATAAGSAGLAAAVAAAYLPTTELRAPQGVATTLGGLSVCLGCVRFCTCIFMYIWLVASLCLQSW